MEKNEVTNVPARKIAAQKIITTSWDDGHPLDLKIAEILSKYGLKGTFYIPAFNPENEVMSVSQLVELAKSFELGGHTKNHVYLTKVSLPTAAREIEDCKEWLGNILGNSPLCFCFPGGKLNKQVVKKVRESGFKYARTIEYLRTGVNDIFRAPTTIQLFRHSRNTYLKNAVKRCNAEGLIFLLKYVGQEVRLVDIVNYFLEKISANGGIFHLWGHSWEIEQYNLWNELEEIIKTLSRLTGFNYCSNGELTNHIP
jgi:peptidoglycan-N-acetylglucosamine deacetylase